MSKFFLFVISFIFFSNTAYGEAPTSIFCKTPAGKSAPLAEDRLNNPFADVTFIASDASKETLAAHNVYEANFSQILASMKKGCDTFKDAKSLLLNTYQTCMGLCIKPELKKPVVGKCQDICNNRWLRASLYVDGYEAGMKDQDTCGTKSPAKEIRAKTKSGGGAS